LWGDYDAGIANRRLAGVAAQAMPVLDEHGKVLHAETVGEIADEPDGDAAPAVPAPSERSRRRAGAGRRVECGWRDEIARDAIADGVS
jgi:Peroxiredoxin